MGRRGPAPEPTRLKIIKGNPGKRPLNKKEPKPQQGIPECPPELAGAARDEWERIAPMLHKIGLLSKVDGAGLAMYCAIYARWLEAEAQIRKHGMLIKSPNGYPMQSPYLNIATQCIKQMRGYLQELGLSASSRSRIEVEREDIETDAEERFFGT